MKLFLAGSFGGAPLRRMLYGSGATDVLLSAAHANARESAGYISEGKEALKIYQAGVPGDSVNAKSLLDESIDNLLASFAAPQAKAAADHFIKEEPVKLFIAGELPPNLFEEICEATGERNLLCTNAAEGSRDRADHFAYEETEPVKLFIAGDRGDVTIQEAEFEESGARNLLYANGAEGGMRRAKEFAVKMASDFTTYHLLIDSGAFTAFKQGTPIVLKDYIAYAKDLQSKAQCEVEFIGLDVITPHGASDEILEQNCQQGYDNWKEMIAAGIPCIPTFHRGDDFKWLDKFARELPPGSRFCIAPKVDGARKDVKMDWLNKVFQRLEEINSELNRVDHILGDKQHKLWERWLIHGLGISSQEIMEAYPWYSVDSTGWLSAAQLCSYRFFDGERIQILSSNKGYIGSPQVPKRTKLAVEQYRISKTHKFKPAVLDERLCVLCGEPEDGHREAQKDNEGLDAGAYWFGKEAIRADVDLALHVTKLWQARGVFFPGEEKLDITGIIVNSNWQHYKDGKTKYHPDHTTFDDFFGGSTDE